MPVEFGIDSLPKKAGILVPILVLKLTVAPVELGVGVGEGVGVVVGVGVGLLELVVKVIPKEIELPGPDAVSEPTAVPEEAMALSPSQLHHCMLSKVPLPKSDGGVIAPVSPTKTPTYTSLLAVVADRAGIVKVPEHAELSTLTGPRYTRRIAFGQFPPTE